jgi:hypothetical protein
MGVERGGGLHKCVEVESRSGALVLLSSRAVSAAAALF